MSERWLLPPLWFDLCWEIGGFGEHPFPLAVRSHGETRDERSALRQRAEPEMAAAGLLVPAGLNPRFADLLSRIANPGLWIEGLYLVDDVTDSPCRLLSVATEDGALLIVQQPGESGFRGGDLRITTHPRTSVGAAAIQGLPPAPPGERPRLAVPLADLERPEPAAAEDAAEPTVEREKTPVEELRAFTEVDHYRDGQFTANLRDRSGRTHRSSVLKWFDVAEPDGRYGLVRTGRELVLSGLNAQDLVRALQDRVAEVRSG
ncbi:ESX secretion-associated protein EspG [Saccharopolyspora griseoalba]|uniref:ESX secretion-associated protein EspG n=1 Tax=Saccharopolyspora griseoalba TaxID=1431848 RepID=A0ABW2LJQ2_9PSEU